MSFNTFMLQVQEKPQAYNEHASNFIQTTNEQSTNGTEPQNTIFQDIKPQSSEVDDQINDNIPQTGQISETPQLPLWKQFFLTEKLNFRTSKGKEKREKQQQDFLQYLFSMRKARGLPTCFAIISSPVMATPYRMDELKIVIGRNTPSQRKADIHIGGNNKMISHEHCSIEWEKERNSYVLHVLSRNGVWVGETPPSKPQHFKVVGEKVVLPNPAFILIQNIPLFFQVFLVTNSSIVVDSKNAENSSEEEDEDDVFVDSKKRKKSSQRSSKLITSSNVSSLSSSSSSKKAKPKSSSSLKPQTSNRVGTLGGITYRQVIQEALIAAGGKATQKEIIEFIAIHHPDIESKKTWKNSVSGILSSNSQVFGTEPAFLPSGKRARYSTWILLDYDKYQQSGALPLDDTMMEGDEEVEIEGDGEDDAQINVESEDIFSPSSIRSEEDENDEFYEV